MSVCAFSCASIRVLDIDEALEHYTGVVGLRETGRDDAGRVYLQAAQRQEHHCLVLNPAERAGLDHLGFLVSDPEDLAEAAEVARAWGVAAQRVPAGALLGRGEALRLTLPSGHDMMLFHEVESVGYATGMRNPDPVLPVGAPGGRVTHFDHTLITAEDPQALIRFLVEGLDFSVTEQVLDPEGNVAVGFLSCSNTMHDLAVSPGENGRLHHMAFGMDSRSDVLRGVDLLRQREVPTFELGVSRHGISGVTTSYFFDPSGNRNEFYNGAYLSPGAPGLLPPVVWHPQDFPRAIFYYERTIPERFFEVVT